MRLKTQQVLPMSHQIKQLLRMRHKQLIQAHLMLNHHKNKHRNKQRLKRMRHTFRIIGPLWKSRSRWSRINKIRIIIRVSRVLKRTPHKLSRVIILLAQHRILQVQPRILLLRQLLLQIKQNKNKTQHNRPKMIIKQPVNLKTKA